jgi:hypothetical protein
MGIPDTLRSEDAEKYVAYLKTQTGRLRSELAWEARRCCSIYLVAISPSNEYG